MPAHTTSPARARSALRGVMRLRSQNSASTARADSAATKELLEPVRRTQPNDASAPMQPTAASALRPGPAKNDRATNSTMSSAKNAPALLGLTNHSLRRPFPRHISKSYPPPPPSSCASGQRAPTPTAGGFTAEISKARDRPPNEAPASLPFLKDKAEFDEAYEKGHFDKLVTTNLTYQPPELADRPWFEAADMSKYAAMIIDFINHDIGLSSMRTPTNKIHSILEKINKNEQSELEELQLEQTEF